VSPEGGLVQLESAQARGGVRGVIGISVTVDVPVDLLTFGSGATQSALLLWMGNAASPTPAPQPGRWVAPPPNDDLADAIPVHPGQTVVSRNAGATRETGEPRHAGNPGGRSLWWKVTPRSAGRVVISSEGSDFDTVLAVYAGHNMGSLQPVAVDDDSGAVRTSRLIFDAVPGTTYAIAVDGYDHGDGKGAQTGTIQLAVKSAEAETAIAASISHRSRTVMVGKAVTAEAMVINQGAAPARACTIALPAGVPARLRYWPLDGETNQPRGEPDAEVDIGPGQAQRFHLAITPSKAFALDLALSFKCANTDPASVLNRASRLFLSAAPDRLADMQFTTDTQTHDGIIVMPGPASTGFMVVSGRNIGAPGRIVFSPRFGPSVDRPAELPLDLFICQTDPRTAACINPRSPVASVAVQVGVDETVTFTLFVAGRGVFVPDDLQRHRIFIVGTQSGRVVGEASAALKMTSGLAERPQGRNASH
jgi:hypothetical protein